jgi:DNA-binding SARP family transcriptional activator
MSFSLKLFGGIQLEGDAGPVTGPVAQRHRLALLAALGLARPRAVGRDKLIAWLWPDRDGLRARQLLNQAVHILRRELGSEAILSAGDDLLLNPQVVDCDAVAFEAALARSDLASAVALHVGPLLDGFFLTDAPEFERWIEGERDRLAGACARSLEVLAEDAERAGDAGEALRWWSARSRLDPYDSRVAVRLMQALEGVGNRAGALQHALSHKRRLREDLELEPDPRVSEAMERLRRQPAAAATPAGLGEREVTVEEAEAAEPGAEPSELEGEVAKLGADPASRPSRRSRWVVATPLAIAAVAAILGGLRMARGSRDSGRGLSPAEERIAHAVVTELDRRDRRDLDRPSHQSRTTSIPAYELVVRGGDPALLRTDSAARVGLGYFRRAVSLDSAYASAWAGLARMLLRVAEDANLVEAASARDEAEMAARRAISLDDSLADAHAMLGMARSLAADYQGAEPHYRRAIALEPDRARLREWAVDFDLLTGRPAEALAEAERAVALDSLSPSATAEVARALLANDRCEEALGRLARLASLDPPLARAAPIAAQCYARLGRWSDAIAVLGPSADGGNALSLALLGYVLGRAGDREHALAIQRALQERWSKGELSARYLAIVPTGLGDRDLAFMWLVRSAREREAGLHPGLRVRLADPVFDDLGNDPRLAIVRDGAGSLR